jgi:hypothetical protein
LGFDEWMVEWLSAGLRGSAVSGWDRWGLAPFKLSGFLKRYFDQYNQSHKK